jgi:NADPH-dependent ferric siderophore reductase
MAKKFLPREGKALHATTARAYSIRGYAHEAGEFDIAVVLVETCWSRSGCRKAKSSASP